MWVRWDAYLIGLITPPLQTDMIIRVANSNKWSPIRKFVNHSSALSHLTTLLIAATAAAWLVKRRRNASRVKTFPCWTGILSFPKLLRWMWNFILYSINHSSTCIVCLSPHISPTDVWHQDVHVKFRTWGWEVSWNIHRFVYFVHQSVRQCAFSSCLRVSIACWERTLLLDVVIIFVCSQ